MKLLFTFSKTYVPEWIFRNQCPQQQWRLDFEQLFPKFRPWILQSVNWPDSLVTFWVLQIFLFAESRGRGSKFSEILWPCLQIKFHRHSRHLGMEFWKVLIQSGTEYQISPVFQWLMLRMGFILQNGLRIFCCPLMSAAGMVSESARICGRVGLHGGMTG